MGHVPLYLQVAFAAAARELLLLVALPLLLN